MVILSRMDFAGRHALAGNRVGRARRLGSHRRESENGCRHSTVSALADREGLLFGHEPKQLASRQINFVGRRIVHIVRGWTLDISRWRRIDFFWRRIIDLLGRRDVDILRRRFVDIFRWRAVNVVRGWALDFVRWRPFDVCRWRPLNVAGWRPLHRFWRSLPQ
ncbi:hypothetical protein KIV56_11490 [Cryobacterium breve]|uniref:Group II intron maturase-specific domain-containing protein n=1 Tax=Cryobacterium breve TaxID=1259258 RepID=A0ABY7N9C5_9MICO|nr:hypothetical protein [Cryobacterium breve]WBM79114.1 hypothetical protein KIV56_11490 [Cryobacterium breve]